MELIGKISSLSFFLIFRFHLPLRVYALFSSWYFIKLGCSSGLGGKKLA